jgi:hypothetical protein
MKRGQMNGGGEEMRKGWSNEGMGMRWELKGCYGADQGFLHENATKVLSCQGKGV